MQRITSHRYQPTTRGLGSLLAHVNPFPYLLYSKRNSVGYRKERNERSWFQVLRGGRYCWVRRWEILPNEHVYKTEEGSTRTGRSKYGVRKVRYY